MNADFDTRAFAPPERFAYWHDVVCRHYCRADSRPQRHGDLAARVRRRSIGCLEVSEIECDAMSYLRLAPHVREAPSEDFLLTVLLEGRAELSQGGRQALQRPGGWALYDTSRPFTYAFAEAYRLVMLKIPRAALLARLPPVERLTAISLDAESSVQALATGMARQALELDLPSHLPAAARVGASIIDVVAAALELRLLGHGGTGSRHANLRQRAKDHMLAHLEDTELDVDRIAHALAVSPRTLSRAFTAEGTTVIRWLWAQRLSASHRALCEGTSSHVTEVAMTCGFSSFSHFSRAFKAAFGASPRTLMRTSFPHAEDVACTSQQVGSPGQASPSAAA
jgi:AraC family transcriptional regulator, positive regulator of tynA and feaB